MSISIAEFAVVAPFAIFCLCFSSDNDWVKKYMEYEVEGARPRARPKKTWREIVKKDRQARKLNRDDAMDCNG